MELPSALSGLSPEKFPLKQFLIFFPKKAHSEKISYIFSKESFSYISVNEALHFLAQARKNKKIHSKKNSLYFTKWNFLALILKDLQETETPKKNTDIPGNRNPKKKLTLWEMEPFSRPQGNILYFRKRKSPKTILLFEETELSYILGKIYSEL